MGRQVGKDKVYMTVDSRKNAVLTFSTKTSSVATWTLTGEGLMTTDTMTSRLARVRVTIIFRYSR